MLVALGLTVVALVVAIASWFRPTHEPVAATPTFTDAQVADAKKQVCDAFNLAHDAIVTAGNIKDPANQIAYATNARLAFFAGAQYLADAVNSQPATPAELATAAHQYSLSYKQISLSLLASKSEEQIGSTIFDAGDQANDKIKQICQ
jgi:hypothetical protein